MSRILIVDDDPYIRELLTQVLSMEHRVEVASDGREALDGLVAGTSMPELILLDINMPVMSGLEFLEASRTLASAQVPTIVMTASLNASRYLGSDSRVTSLCWRNHFPSMPS